MSDPTAKISLTKEEKLMKWKETKAEIKTRPVITKTKKVSVQYNLNPWRSLCASYPSNQFGFIFNDLNSYYIYIFQPKFLV